MSKSILAERATGTTDKDLSEGAAKAVVKAEASRKAGQEPKKSWAEKLRDNLPNKPESKKIKSAGASAGSKLLMSMKATGLRVANVLFAVLLIEVTAVKILPLIAMWLWEQLGLVLSGEPTMQALLALWLVPLLFLSAGILVAEITVIKVFWRWSSGRINAMKAAANPVHTTAPSQGRAASNRKGK